MHSLGIYMATPYNSVKRAFCTFSATSVIFSNDLVKKCRKHGTKLI